MAFPRFHGRRRKPTSQTLNSSKYPLIQHSTYHFSDMFNLGFISIQNWWWNMKAIFLLTGHLSVIVHAGYHWHLELDLTGMRFTTKVYWVGSISVLRKSKLSRFKIIVSNYCIYSQWTFVLIHLQPYIYIYMLASGFLWFSLVFYKFLWFSMSFLWVFPGFPQAPNLPGLPRGRNQASCQKIHACARHIQLLDKNRPGQHLHLKKTMQSGAQP